MNPEGPFHAKCAYCEVVIEGNQPGDMEHFRPKKEVRDFDNRIIEKLEGGIRIPHPGYYWLAYDWTNLLLSCNECNRRRTPSGGQQGKGSRFPVDGEHGWIPGSEANERHLLLNPMWDDPCEHLSIDETGVFVPLTDRGDSTLKLFCLNERGLPDRRARHYQDVLDSAKQAIIKLLEHGKDELQVQHRLRRISRIVAGYEGYTAAGRQAIKEMDANAPGMMTFCLKQYLA